MQVKQSVLQARETITGHSFALENHTIDEEEEDLSQKSLSPVSVASKNSSTKRSHQSTYASVPHTTNLGRIDEESFDEGKIDTASAKNPVRSPIAKEEKRLDAQSHLPPKSPPVDSKIET